jgi:hypothetical protein
MGPRVSLDDVFVGQALRLRPKSLAGGVPSRISQLYKTKSRRNYERNVLLIRGLAESVYSFSAEAGGEAVKRSWQYWTFSSFGLAATVIVTIWVTKIARDALWKTEAA